MNSQRGFAAIETLLVIGVVILLILILFLRASLTEQVVSGVVYNNQNNALISGNTTFSVRANENTMVTEENKSSYCLPPNSPYISLINEAARNKSIKVIVTTEKALTFVPTPWTCIDNVKVERQ